MQELQYAVLDVFAQKAFEGNPLAVFADGNGLSSEQMQSIAREMQLSETTFVLPRAPAIEAKEGVRVRIFTTEEELPFAGHPTLGTATFLRESRTELQHADTVQLQLNVGIIPVVFAAQEQGQPGHFGTMRQRDPEFGPELANIEALARALNFDPQDVGLSRSSSAPVQVVSTGNPFCIVPVRDIQALGAMQYSAKLGRTLLERIGARFFFCVAPADGGRWRGRMQFSGGEDPATGSAAGCVAAWLVRHGLVESGSEVVLEQGIEILRPSRLLLRATRTPNGEVKDVFVGGRTIRVAEGRLFLP